MKSGKVQRQDYHYKRNGTCCVMMAIEPLAGKRIVEVKERKTKKDYALFMKKVEKVYRKAKKIILVQDNLNTHNLSSFYETFSPKTAFYPFVSSFQFYFIRAFYYHFLHFFPQFSFSLISTFTPDRIKQG